MSDTAHLALPLIAAEQAQKHVTHNEAIAALDALVQLSVKDRDIAAPPGSPAEGDRYIVAASATGDWTGEDGKIAVFAAGAWAFHTPREGWRAWVDDENVLLVHNGSVWLDLSATITVLQNLALLGVGTTADATNPFSAKLNKALWTAKYAAEGGDGDLRYTLNKESAADVVSLLLQRGFSGRAELGLIGDDDFTLKVSPDGSAWVSALVVDKDDGTLKAVAGSAAAPAVSFGAVGDGFYQAASGTIALSLAGTAKAAFVSANKYVFGGTTFENIIPSTTTGFQVQGTTAGQGSFYNVTWNNAVSGPQNVLAKSRGTSINTHGAVASGDALGTLAWYGDDGTSWIEVARIKAEVDATPGTNDMPARLVFSTTADGAAAVTERMRIDSSGNLQMGGTNTVIDANRHVRLRSYTTGTLPSASVAAGQTIYCSDLGGGGGLLVSDGTTWRRGKEAGYGALATDAAFTLTPLTSAPDFRHTGTLTADRALTLSATNAYAGARFRVTRTGGGAFNITNVLKNIATNQWAEFVYDGSAWYLAAFGSL